MRFRFVIVTAAALVALLVAGVATALYDHSRRDTIADGVRVVGIDVGGLSVERARVRLEHEYLAKLREPIVVHHGTRSFKLGARESRVAADLAGMVDEALKRGREGTILGRTWRGLTGIDIDVDVAPRTTFSRAASLRLVDRVRALVDRPAADAELRYRPEGIVTVPSRDGLVVLASQLRVQVERAIVDPRADHTLVARTRHDEPAVTTDELAERYGTLLVVHRKGFRLRLYKDLKLAKTYPIAVGKVGLETPAGLYKIQNKAIDPAWYVPNSKWAGKLAGKVIPGGAPNNPIKSRWLGVYDGVGVHGTSDDASIGSNASHGCIRMHVRDVKALYDEVPVGTPIYIA